MLFHSCRVQGDELPDLKWAQDGTLPDSDAKLLGFAGPIAGVTNDIFITGGGANFPDTMPWHGGKKKYYDDLFLYNRNEHDSLIRFASFKLPFPLAYAACVSTNRGVVVAGGENDSGVSNRVLLLNLTDERKEVTIEFLPELPVGVTAASAVVVGEVVYVAGGDDGKSASTQFVYLDLNLTDPVWKSLPSLLQPTSHGVMAAQRDGGKDYIYLIGGRKRNADRPSDLYETVSRFDPEKRIWQKLKPLPYPLSAGTGAAAGSSGILLFGGDTGETFHRTEELILDIAQEKDHEKKQRLIKEKEIVQSGHPGFSKKVLAYSVHTNQWKETGEIPFDSPVTTVAVAWDEKVIIPGGEIRAGVRTPQIISVKINQP